MFEVGKHRARGSEADLRQVRKFCVEIRMVLKSRFALAVIEEIHLQAHEPTEWYRLDGYTMLDS